MDNLETMGVLNAGNQLLEDAPGLVFRHPAVLDDIVKELAAGVFENKDDVRRGRDDFVPVLPR